MPDRDLPRLAVLRRPPPRASPRELDAWAADATRAAVDHARRRRRLPAPRRALGEAGWLRAVRARGLWRRCAPASTCARSAWPARRSPITTGSPTSPSRCRASAPAPIALFGTRRRRRQRYLPRGRRGRGDRRVRAVRARGRLRRRRACAARATPTATATSLDGEKTWISNGGIADFYVVFARTGEAPGAQGHLGLRRRRRRARARDRRAHRRDRAASAGDAALRRTAACRWRSCIGEPGEGFKVAMRTLDVFRSTVGAAALGFARRALDEALAPGDARAAVRRAAGRPPADAGEARRHGDRRSTPPRCSSTAPPGRRTRGAARVTREAAMAKLYATEARAAGDRRRGADLRRPRRDERASRSSGSTARSARCASTRARPRSRSSSSRARC